MSRSIPLDIVPSHVYLSASDQKTLFGENHALTIHGEHSHPGQIVYEETIQVKGSSTHAIRLRVLGPNWEKSHVEITPTEAAMLGIEVTESKSGNVEEAKPCTLIGPEGEVNLEKGLIVPRPHLTCNVKDAEALNVQNGQEVNVEIVGAHQKIEKVIVRVHPMFRLRIEIHQDLARDLWLTRSMHATILR